MQSSVANI
ncbi:hypothetical protein OIU77_001568, partial [Salix suchowensis]